MITPQQILRVWAPIQSPWSPWVKPVLFAQTSDWSAFTDLDDLMLRMPGSPLASPPASSSLVMDEEGKMSKAAVVVDLLGAEAVNLGLMLARTHGFRPVPLFNGCAGENEVVPTGALRQALISGTAQLARLPVADDAPPAFLLDRNRLPPQPELLPGQYDNRWMVFLQDFPSADFLRKQGITGILLIQPQADAPLHDDLAHVLRRWQAGGLSLHHGELAADGRLRVQTLHVPLPSLFREYWHRTMRWLSLSRNASGGFGEIISSSSSG